VLTGKEVASMDEEYITYYSNGYYKLFKNGKIQKPDGYISDGKSWEFIGLKKKLPFGNTGHLIPREECFNIPKWDMKFKNGVQKYVVVDRDHGTLRTWG
jgi:hypothetical protein